MAATAGGNELKSNHHVRGRFKGHDATECTTRTMSATSFRCHGLGSWQERLDRSMCFASRRLILSAARLMPGIEGRGRPRCCYALRALQGVLDVRGCRHERQRSSGKLSRSGVHDPSSSCSSGLEDGREPSLGEVCPPPSCFSFPIGLRRQDLSIFQSALRQGRNRGLCTTPHRGYPPFSPPTPLAFLSFVRRHW